MFFMFLTLNRILFFAFAIPVGAVSVSLAFVKINEVPLVNYLIYGIGYFFNPKQFIFKKEEKTDLGGIGIEKEIIIKEK